MSQPCVGGLPLEKRIRGLGVKGERGGGGRKCSCRPPQSRKHSAVHGRPSETGARRRMCDRMMVALLVDTQKVPEGGGADSARIHVWNLIREGGLGTIIEAEKESLPSGQTRPEISEAELKKWIERDRRYTLIIKERLQAALAGPRENMI